jgi:hypothetical protein
MNDLAMTTEAPTAVDELLKEILEKKSAEAAPEAVEEEDVDLDKLKQRIPPKEGICRRCGQDKPINRLMLCYVCWVKANLEDSGWREGMEHPAWCQCAVPGAHGGLRSSGN